MSAVSFSGTKTPFSDLETEKQNHSQFVCWGTNFPLHTQTSFEIQCIHPGYFQVQVQILQATASC
jgi:hypothetical protein